jgi:hypothetical protein
MISHVIKGALSYVLVTFPLGFFWHLHWFASSYQGLEIYRSDVIIPMGLGSMLVQALAFSWMYPKLFDTQADAWRASALKCFVVFGLLSWSFTTLAVGAKHRMTSVPDYFLIETAFTMVQFCLLAPLLSWVHRQAVAP